MSQPAIPRSNECYQAAIAVLEENGVLAYSFEYTGKHPKIVFDYAGLSLQSTIPSTPSDVNSRHATDRAMRHLLERARAGKVTAANIAARGVDKSAPSTVSRAKRGSKDMPMLSSLLNRASKRTPNSDANLFSVANVSEARRAKAWLDDRLRKSAAEGVVSEVVEVTPVLAEILLASNPGNRSINEDRVSAYATDIANGDWSLNGEPIIVSDTGLLNDGQHRCSAVVKAARSIKAVVTIGVERDSRLTVDQGKVRTAGDYLGMEGIADANHVAAVASYVWQYEQKGRLTRSTKDLPTKVQIQQSLRDHPKIIESLHSLPSASRNIARSRSILAFCHYLFSRRSGHTAATYFLMRLMIGDELKTTDPIYLCRERLNSSTRMRPEEKVELIFRAWNHSRRAARGLKAPASKLVVMGNLPELER